MTVQNYLDALSKELRFLKAHERDEVLADYTEHFDMALAQGESIERVMGRLGSPKSVAKEYERGRRVAKAVAKPSAKSVARAVGAVILSGVYNALVIAPLYVCGALVLVVFYAASVGTMLGAVAGAAAMLTGNAFARSVAAGFGLSNLMVALLMFAVAAAGGELFIFARAFGRWFFRMMAALAHKLVGRKEITA